jgi:hypothetical protein
MRNGSKVQLKMETFGRCLDHGLNTTAGDEYGWVIECFTPPAV